MNKDGHFVRTIAHNQTNTEHAKMIQHPRALTFYQLHGTLYFSDWGDNAHIGRIGMDGSNVEILLDKKSVKIATLTYIIGPANFYIVFLLVIFD